MYLPQRVMASSGDKHLCLASDLKRSTRHGSLLKVFLTLDITL